MQNTTKNIEAKHYETILQPDDNLMILISAENPEVAAPYNLRIQQAATVSGSENTTQLQSYLIDKEGMIEFPILGKLKLAGLNRSEAIDFIKNKLENHITNPVVNLRILNFKITVLGEVNKPGLFPLSSERITLLEALSLAGDLTIYGNRKEIKLIRELNGEKQIQSIDITSSDFLSSEYYYLKQNDVIYVEPNKTKVNSSIIGPNVAIGISAVSLLVTILALTIR